MRILVNHSAEDRTRLGALAFILRNMNINAVSTGADLTIGELLYKAKQASCDAIVVSNESTLRYLVPGDKPTVDKWRGSRLNFEVPTFIINKLAHIDTVPYGRWLLEKDLGKLKYAKVDSKKFTYSVLDQVKYFKDAYEDLSKAIAIAYDIETKTLPGPDELTGGPTIITCASWTGIYLDGSLRTYVLPLVNFLATHWETDEEYETAIFFLRKINSLAVAKGMHNGMYDATHSIRYHAEPNNWVYDTMAMAHAEFSELPKSLDFVASHSLYDYIFWKDDSEEAAKKKDIKKYWGYNAKDTWYTARLMIHQLRNAPEYAKRNYANKFKLVYPSLYCNFEGLLIDQEARTELRKSAEEKNTRAKARLQTMFADPGFNPGSWQQVEKYIYNVFGAKKPGLGKSKSGTDEKNLSAVGEQHPLLARLTGEIIDYRESQKAIGTYYDFLQYNGRLLWALNPFGTETERMACSSSSLWVGTQVQNIPGYAKGMLIADPGFEIFEADNKQSEGRTTAYCAQDEALIAALEDAERDFYKTLGTLFFEIPYEEVTDFFRNKVLKKIVHGTNYVMGAGTFIENIGARILYETAEKLGVVIVDVPKKNSNQKTLKMFAKDLLECYHTPFNKIRPWYETLKNEIAATGFLVSPDEERHTRRFFGDINKNHSMFRSAVAHQPQNLSVRILNKGFFKVYKDLVIPGNGDIRIKAQIHDSVFGQWRIEKRDFYAQEVLKRMDNPVVVHGRTLRIPVDIKYGHRWAEREVRKDGTIENPDGTVKWKGPK